jgi:hypothetical protein
MYRARLPGGYWDSTGSYVVLHMVPEKGQGSVVESITSWRLLL